MKQYQDITDPAVAKALAHPLRTRILAALENRTASPTELATEMDAPLGVVSYHVRRLHALRFLKLVKRVPRRGAVEHYYTTVAGPRITDEAWMSTPTIVKQATISAALAELGSQATSALAGGGFDRSDCHLTRTPVTVDAQGWKEISRELSAMLARIQEIEAESHERLLRSDHDDEHRATVGLMLFQSTTSAPAEPVPAPRRTRSRPSKASRNGRSG
ncbi:MAG TPA: winged helix-turn-helix domain-containing protein [Solirubrobacteraceae bacterium]|nr:winged helix-turn-helix domain-containing protein [Solirubrobacteraceae bacterium]